MALIKKLSDFQNALQRLEEAYRKTIAHQNEQDYTFFRDSTIQRFEFTLEIAWKTIKSFLLEKDGIECRSPKGCMRDFFTAGHISEAEAVRLMAMIDDRNLSTHTYHEALADEIFAHIEEYLETLKKIFLYMQNLQTKK